MHQNTTQHQSKRQYNTKIKYKGLAQPRSSNYVVLLTLHLRCIKKKQDHIYYSNSFYKKKVFYEHS